jgi:hypothetical protein
MGIRLQHDEVRVGNVSTVEVRRGQRDAHRGVRG